MTHTMHLVIFLNSADLAFPETVHPKKFNFEHSTWMTPGLPISCKT